MTSYRQGSTALLTVQWSEYAGGPAVDVTGLTVTITRLSDSAVIVAATSTGIAHIATGLSTYSWAIASDALQVSYAAVWNATGPSGAVQASEIVTVVAAFTSTVTVDDVVEYIGPDVAAQWLIDESDVQSYPEIQDALDAEVADQAKRVSYPDDSDVSGWADLDQALKRRVQRNLAMRALPLAMQTNTELGIVARPGGRDPEVRRFEAGHPRLPAG